MTRDLRSAAALAVVLALPLVPVAAVIAVVVVVVDASQDPPGDPRPHALVVAFVVTAVAVMSTVLPSGWRSTEGVVLDGDRHRLLWDEVRAISVAVGTRTPDEVWLVAGPDLELVDDGGWYGLRRGTRRLLVGAHLLVILEPAELRAQLAHELAHLSTLDSRLRPVLHRARQLALAAGAGRPGRDRLLEAVEGLFLVATRVGCRSQEDLADRLAARIAGTEASVSSILRRARAAAVWRTYLELYVLSAIDVRMRPADFVDGFAECWAARADGTPEEEPSISEADPRDFHVQVGQRLAAARAEVLEGWDPPSWSRDDLVSSLHEPIEDMTDDWFRETNLAPAGWDDMAHGACSDLAIRTATYLGRPLDQAVALLAWGGERTLVEHLADETGTDLDHVPPDEVRSAAEDLVLASIEVALVTARLAHYEMRFDGAPALVDGGGRPVEVDELVATCADGAEERGALAEFVRAAGIADFVPPPPPPRPVRTIEGGFMSLAYVARMGPGRVLGITEHLVVVSGVPKGMRARWRPDLGEIELLERIREAGPDVMLGRRDAWVARWEEVVEVRVGRLGRVTIRRSDGRRKRVKLQGFPSGDLVDAMRRCIGDRVRGPGARSRRRLRW